MPARTGAPERLSLAYLPEIHWYFGQLNTVETRGFRDEGVLADLVSSMSGFLFLS